MPEMSRSGRGRPDGLFDCSFFPSLIAQMCPLAAEWAAHALWGRSSLRCLDWWGWEMSVPWSAVTGWRLCGAGLLKVHCTQRRARTPASLQQAKWTFLESLGLFNTPLGLKVTLLVLPGWRWRWWFCYESGFAVRVRGAGETRGDLLIRVKLAPPFTPKAHCALARDRKQQLCCRALSVCFCLSPPRCLLLSLFRKEYEFDLDAG